MAIDHHDFWQQKGHQLANIHQEIIHIALCAPSFLLPNWAWLFNRKPNSRGSYFHNVSNLLLQLCHKFDQERQEMMNSLNLWQLHISHLHWNFSMTWFDFQWNAFLVALQALFVWWSLSLPFLISSSHSWAKEFPMESND